MDGDWWEESGNQRVRVRAAADSGRKDLIRPVAESKRTENGRRLHSRGAGMAGRGGGGDSTAPPHKTNGRVVRKQRLAPARRPRGGRYFTVRSPRRQNGRS